MPPLPPLNLLPRLARALRVALLLPALLLLLPGHPGSWYCGSGAWCGSAADLTCCCGPAHPAAADGCLPDGGTLLTAGHTCDCYYQAAPSPAAQFAGRLALTPPDASPAPEFSLPAPRALRRSPRAATLAESPPPPLLSETATRGPPASRSLPA